MDNMARLSKCFSLAEYTRTILMIPEKLFESIENLWNIFQHSSVVGS